MLEHPLNTLLEGYCGACSPAASSFQAHLDYPVGTDLYEFNIATVSLQKGAYFIENFLDFLLHRFNLLSIRYIICEHKYLYVPSRANRL